MDALSYCQQILKTLEYVVLEDAVKRSTAVDPAMIKKPLLDWDFIALAEYSNLGRTKSPVISAMVYTHRIAYSETLLHVSP